MTDFPFLSLYQRMALLPNFTPFTLEAIPSLTRSLIRSRSNSAIAPSIVKRSLLAENDFSH